MRKPRELSSERLFSYLERSEGWTFSEERKVELREEVFDYDISCYSSARAPKQIIRDFKRLVTWLNKAIEYLEGQ